MSDTPQNPSDPTSSAPASSSAPSQPPTASDQPTSNGSRWTSLALAVAVVTVGGFILGRASGPQAPEPAAPVPSQPVANRRVPLPVAKLNPSVMARLREARSLRADPMAGMGPKEAWEAAPGENLPPGAPDVTRQALAVLRPKFDACVSQNKPLHGGQVLVSAKLHPEGDATVVAAAKLARSNLGSPQTEQCLVRALQNAPLPGVKAAGDSRVLLPFLYMAK